MTPQEKFSQQADIFQAFITGLVLGATAIMAFSVVVGQ